jgi:hypothetical protein
MAFTGFDMHDVAHIDLTLVMLRRYDAGAGAPLEREQSELTV